MVLQPMRIYRRLFVYSICVNRPHDLTIPSFNVGNHLKAAILVAQNAPLEVAEVQAPKLDIGQVLVELAYSGICGKQIEEITGKRGDDPYIPHMLGHEGSGTVLEIGPGVRKVKPGDKVILHWIKGPGIDSMPPRYRWNGTEVSSGWVTTFNQLSIASENRVTPIDADTDMDIACLLGCAVTTGLGIVFNNSNLKPAESIAVFGVGGIGINVIQGAALVNAYPIIAIDLLDHKLQWAKDFGATHVINAQNENPKEALRNLTGGSGVDVTVDTTGNTSVRQTAYNTTSDTGRVVFAGVPTLDEHITIDSFPLHFGRRMIGSHGGETRPEIDIARYLKLYDLGKLKLKEQITHRYSLDQINDAVSQVRAGETGRCVIKL